MRPIAFRDERAVNPMDFLDQKLRSAFLARSRVRNGDRATLRVFHGIGILLVSTIRLTFLISTILSLS